MDQIIQVNRNEIGTSFYTERRSSKRKFLTATTTELQKILKFLLIFIQKKRAFERKRKC